MKRIVMEIDETGSFLEIFSQIHEVRINDFTTGSGQPHSKAK